MDDLCNSMDHAWCCLAWKVLPYNWCVGSTEYIAATMGFDEDQFVTRVGDDKKCVLCRGVAETPVRSPCERLYCWGCILPRVLQTGRCPGISDCKCEGLSPADLVSVLDLQNTILNMEVKCDNAARGCRQLLTLSELEKHTKSCPFRAVKCRNRGCGELVNQMDLNGHETEYCECRPVGICHRECGLVVQYREQGNHVCLEALRSHIAAQELTICSLQVELRQLNSKAAKREKNLLAQVSGLHREIQTHARHFQKKLNDYNNHIEYLSRRAALCKVSSELNLY